VIVGYVLIDMGLWNRWLWTNAERAHRLSARHCIWSHWKVAGCVTLNAC